MMKKLRYAKIHKYAYDLERANPSDAGMDIRYAPEDGDPTIIRPAGNEILETGLKFEIEHGYMVEIMNRSSMASKGLLVGAHVIDSGYEGEILINLHNLSPDSKGKPIKIKPGDKIAQAVYKPICTGTPRQIKENELYEDTKEVKSDRGTGGFGSTGRR